MAEIDFNKLQTTTTANDGDFLFVAPSAGVSDSSTPDATADVAAASNPPRLIQLEKLSLPRESVFLPVEIPDRF